MTEKETPDAVSPENAANLLKLEEELKRSRDHWGQIEEWVRPSGLSLLAV